MNHTRVGGHPVAGAQQHDIARHQIAGCHDGFQRVTKHACHWRGHLSQRLERPPRTMLLDEPEHYRKQDDDRDHDGLECVTEESRYGRRRKQDQNQDVLELRREGTPRGRTGRHLQLVRAVGAEALRRLIPGETRQICGELLQRFFDRQGVPDRGMCVGRRHYATPHPATALTARWSRRPRPVS